MPRSYTGTYTIEYVCEYDNNIVYLPQSSAGAVIIEDVSQINVANM